MKFKGISYDKQYLELCKRIIDHGSFDTDPRPKYADGTPAHVKSVFFNTMTFSPTDIPLLFSKRVYYRQAIEEMLWIFQQRSNVVKDLEDKNVYIWSDWTLDDGTIGRAYGAQLNKNVGHSGMNQVDNLIHNLKTNPESRRHVISLWDVEDVDDGSLYPCVWQSQYVVQGDKLHMEVMARSQDVALGTCFNVFQYWVLHKLICNEVGIEPGDMVFVMVNSHLYDRHIPTIKEQYQRYNTMAAVFAEQNKQIEIEIDDVGFYDFTIDNIRVKGYDQFGNQPLQKYKFEVGI